MTSINENLEDRVQKWLGEQGYPLEMRVARQFRSNSWWVLQASYYSDVETKQQREIDIIAYRNHYLEGSKSPLLEISICVECKYSKDKPWILFSSENREEPTSFLLPVLSTDTFASLEKTIMELNPLPKSLFKPQSRLGYGLTQAFTTSKDLAYEAVMGVAKAAIAKAQERPRNKINEQLISLVFPVVLVDGILFEAFLSHQGEVELHKSEHGILNLSYEFSSMEHPIQVHVCTLSGLADLLSKLDESDRFVLRFYEATIDKKKRKDLILELDREWREYEESRCPIPKEILKLLFEHIMLTVTPVTCDNTLAKAKEFLTDRDLYSNDVVNWLNQQGGNCDCEVILNVEHRWRNWLR